MRSEWKLFGLISGFLFVMAIIYGFWTHGAEPLHHVEWIGTTALVLSGLLCLMCFTYFWFVSRRIDLRPEDQPEAEISDGAGEVGFFSPGSYWPFGIALAALVAGLGLVYWQVWLLVVGMIAVLIGAGGLLFEYYTGARRAAE
jgi:hypothetical protein